jgi:hypothetical protein
MLRLAPKEFQAWPGLIQIEFAKGEIRILLRLAQVGHPAQNQIVHAHDPMAQLQKPIHQVTADEACGAGYERDA